MRERTQLDFTRKDHAFLVGMLSIMINDYGYGPRELYELIEDSKSQLFFSFMEMHEENLKKAGK